MTDSDKIALHYKATTFLCVLEKPETWMRAIIK